MKSATRQLGFTLIEILVVLIILAAIALIAIPNILNLMGSGKEEAAAAELHTVLVAVQAAMSESEDKPPVVVAYESGSRLIANSAAPLNDPSRYLINDTSWTYTITENGQVAQGEKVS
ncbi:MAG: prepilin-type N-terminal cleavage/methylation domain-containing protein [Dehalococcoidaceae bacterium]|nr:prepilin-type N-terminal cleavage/methylation domain-containing protein [Dehalococcoidaceae bacterium]